MAHFAKIENNKVTEVIVISNKVLNDIDYPESELIGQEFIASLNLDGTWLQTSYNNNFRAHFAGVDYIYNEELDAFIPPKPFDSWVLDESIYNWVAPVEYPNDGTFYFWNEDIKNWDTIKNELE